MTLPNVLFLAPLEGVELTGPLDGTEMILGGELPITNSAIGIAEYLSPFKEHIPKIGHLRYDSFMKSKTFVYLPLTYESPTDIKQINGREYLSNLHEMLQAYFRGLWLVKDFAISYELFLFTPDYVHVAMFLNSTLFDSQGDLSSVAFSKEDLETTELLVSKLFGGTGTTQNKDQQN